MPWSDFPHPRRMLPLDELPPDALGRETRTFRRARRGPMSMSSASVSDDMPSASASRNRRFDPVPLQRGIRCELDLGEGGFADEIAAASPGDQLATPVKASPGAYRRIICRDLADAAKPPTGRDDLPFKHRFDIEQPQIGEADDAGANFGLAAAPVALIGNRPDELAFADRAHFLGTAGPIARTTLDEHGRDDVVPRVDVGQEFVEQIAAARVIPEMMVRIDDRQIGPEDLLGQLAEPYGIGQRAGIGACFATGVWGHGIPPRGRPTRWRRLLAAPFSEIYSGIYRAQKSHAISPRDRC